MKLTGAPLPTSFPTTGMPKEALPKPNRWEGTHTYKKPDAEKKKARTVAQLREETAAKSKASREAIYNRRRGSIGGASPGPNPNTRRGSTGGIVTTITAPATSSPQSSSSSSTNSGYNTANEDTDADMPGSNKKNRNKSGEPPSSGEPGEGVDPALIRFLNAMKEDIVQSTRETVGKLESRLDSTEKGLAALEKKVEDNDRKVAEQISAEVAKMSGQPALSQGVMGRREEAYHRCRRSLRVWPIEGDDLPDSVRNFMKTRLKMSDERIRSLGSIVVSLLPSKASREKKEVIVTFDSADERDFVKSNGPHLAGQREAGMALHVPGHLMDNLAALNGLAYSIKQKFGNTRRAVKFDDGVQDVYLDICIAGNWRKVTPQEARQALKEVPAASSMGSISVSDLTNLIQGKEVPGLTVAVVPEESME